MAATLVSNVHSVTAVTQTSPTSLAAEALDYNQVKLTYSEPSGDHWGYDIEISWDAGVTWHWWRRVPTAANTLTWTGRSYSGVALLAGFKAATTYHFRLRTVTPGDDSETFGSWSASASVVTPAYRTASGGGVTVYTVSSNAEWETARDLVKYGDFIDIDANFLVEGYQIAYLPEPQVGGTDGFVTIRTPNVIHTPYVRAAAADKATMGGFEANSTNSPAFMTAKSVDRILFESIRFENVDKQIGHALLACSYDGENWDDSGPAYSDTLAEVPSHIECHGCLFLNTPETYTVDVGIWADCHFFVLQDSDIDTIYNSEAKGIGNSQGSVKWIANTKFQSEAMHFLAGGQSPFTDLGIYCLQFHRNYFYRDPAWAADGSWYAKNFWELKDGQWAVLKGNRFEHDWRGGSGGASGQDWSIVLTPIVYKADQCVERVYITDNWFEELSGGIVIRNAEDNVSSVFHVKNGTNRVQFENNVMHLIEHADWPADQRGGSDGVYFGGSDGYDGSLDGEKAAVHIYVRHNVFVNVNDNAGDRLHGVLLGAGRDWPYDPGLWFSSDIVIEDNVLFGGVYGVVKGRAHGYTTMDEYFGDGVWTFRNNCIFTEEAEDHLYNTTTQYPVVECPGCVFVTSNISDVDFVDYTVPNYRAATGGDLDGTASDGGDIGADIDAIEAATENCISGDWT